MRSVLQVRTFTCLHFARLAACCFIDLPGCLGCKCNALLIACFIFYILCAYSVYHCSAPHPDETLAMYFGTVYIPSYPAREVCEKYEDECPVLNTFFPAECNQTLPSGAQVFPATDQVICTVEILLLVLECMCYAPNAFQG